MKQSFSSSLDNQQVREDSNASLMSLMNNAGSPSFDALECTILNVSGI